MVHEQGSKQDVYCQGDSLGLLHHDTEILSRFICTIVLEGEGAQKHGLVEIPPNQLYIQTISV